MSQNPYEATDLGDEIKGVLSGTREDLRKVASAQKGVMLCLLINIALLFGVNFAPGGIRPIIGGVMLIAGLASAVFVFLLASRTYNIGIAILLLVVSIIPCVGLLVLLMVNQKATSVLKQNGIRVGFLGAIDPI